MTSKKSIQIYSDGACTGKKGVMGIGYSIQSNGDILKTYSKRLGYGDINEAKYIAIVESMKTGLNFNPKEITIYSSSKLAVNQINGRWNTKDPVLKKHLTEINKMKKRRKIFKFEFVAQDDLVIADYLALSAIGKKM